MLSVIYYTVVLNTAIPTLIAFRQNKTEIPKIKERDQQT
jgi:hypothetical protein